MMLATLVVSGSLPLWAHPLCLSQLPHMFALALLSVTPFCGFLVRCVCCALLPQGLVDPATGELYYMSHITSASLWEKRNETLRSEAELRRLVVPRLDNEFRGEVRACVRFACVWTHMCLWVGMGGECGW